MPRGSPGDTGAEIVTRAGADALRTGCKINAFLRVLRRREDGYHNIESLLLPLDEPHDEIHVGLSPVAPPGTARCAFFAADAKSAVPRPLEGIDPEKNTLTRACALFAEASDFAPALDIRVIKGVPQGAGLGGGSANAAALLLHLQKKAAQAGAAPLSAGALFSLAARVGADVPFFLFGSPALVSGIGERLAACASPFPGRYLVLVCPRVSVATPWAFNALDQRRETLGRAQPVFFSKKAPERDAFAPDGCYADGEMPQKKSPMRLTNGTARATTAPDRAHDFQNDFEEVVFAAFPEIARLYGILCGTGAELVRMSGTGASLFAVYKEKNIAASTAKTLAKENASVYTQRLPAS